VSLHWSFLHSCSWRITDLCRRFTSAVRAGSLVSCHCLLSRFFRRISSWIRAGIGGRGSARGRLLGMDTSRLHQWRWSNSRHTCQCLPHLRFPSWTECYYPGMPETWTKRSAWNLDGQGGWERMIDTWYRSICVSDLNWVLSTQSDAPEWEGFWLPRYLGHRGLQRGCMGRWWVNPARGSSRNACRHNHVGAFLTVVSREFQSTCLALRSPAIRTGSPPLKQAVRSDLSRGWEGEIDRQDLSWFASQLHLDGSCLQVPHTRDWLSVMLYIPTDQNSCSAALRRSVCSVADIVCETNGLPWVEMCLTYEADIVAVLCEKMV
jgi:hypothetical protein